MKKILLVGLSAVALLLFMLAKSAFAAEGGGCLPPGDNRICVTVQGQTCCIDCPCGSTCYTVQRCQDGTAYVGCGSLPENICSGNGGNYP